MTLGSSPQGESPRGIPKSPNAKYVAFLSYGLLLRAFSFSPLCTHFIPLLSFPKEVNKKLIYCRQNVLSIIKHESNDVSEHTNVALEKGGRCLLHMVLTVSCVASTHLADTLVFLCFNN